MFDKKAAKGKGKSPAKFKEKKHQLSRTINFDEIKK